MDVTAGFTENGRDTKKKPSRIKKKNAVRKVQTVATADIYHCF